MFMLESTIFLFDKNGKINNNAATKILAIQTKRLVRRLLICSLFMIHKWQKKKNWMGVRLRNDFFLIDSMSYRTIAPSAIQIKKEIFHESSSIVSITVLYISKSTRIILFMQPQHYSSCIYKFNLHMQNASRSSLNYFHSQYNFIIKIITSDLSKSAAFAIFKLKRRNMNKICHWFSIESNKMQRRTPSSSLQQSAKCIICLAFFFFNF